MKRYGILAVSTLAVLSVFVRMFFGFDLTDESQYIAQAFGPVLGGELFVTDRLFQQSGSLWATPFLWLYLTLTGTTTGLVLFFRFLYLAFGFLTSYVLFKALRKNLNIENAAALSVLPILYMPFCIPGVSYNTMGVLLTIMSFALWRLFKASKKPSTGGFLALTLAMGVFSYPPLGLAYLIFFVFELRDRSFLKKNKKNIMRIALGSLAILGLFAISVFSIGMAELEKNFAIAKAVSLLTAEAKWALSINYLKLFFPSYIYWLLIPVLAGVYYYRGLKFEFAALPVLAVFYIFLAPEVSIDVNFGFLIYALTVTFILKAVQKKLFKEKWKLHSEIAASIFAGLLMGFTSGNGIINAALGFSVAFLFMFESAAIRNKKFPAMAWVCLVVIYCYSPWAFFYREGRLPELTYRMDSGPFYGIYTNSFKHGFLTGLESDLKSVPAEAKSVFIYDSLPAGYLITSLEPITFMYYMHPMNLTPSLRGELLSVFRDQGVRPDVIVETLMVPVSAASGFITSSLEENIYQDPFFKFFRNHPEYRVFRQRYNYIIYVRRPL
jgi:hypothetical protein